MPGSAFAQANVTLAWNPSTNPVVAGFNIYYGGASGVYTNKTSVGMATSLTISNLLNGSTYYFAATTYSAAGAESALSSEVSYTVPATVSSVNQPPTLNPIGNLTINENAAAQPVALSGISDGPGDSGQTLTVTAKSSNTGLIPNPSVSYTSPSSTGSLSLSPAANATGSATVTVTVTDSGASNNLASQAFTVTVNSIVSTNNTGPIDQTAPTINLVSPTNNLHVTNSAFTATGKAGDNVGVNSVYYSLDGSGWTLAATTNHWTKWTAGLALTPGTNTLQAYAVDTSGNLSTTNTVHFEYIVRTPLTVAINGKGTLTPNYNGKLLALNLGYAMTATTAPGFRFTNWSGSLTTNTSTLRFLMASNLTFTANFVDVARPVVSITSPTNNLHVTNSAFTATGKAGDNVGVNSVYYSLDGSGWTLAATTNHWTKWTAGLALTPGTNTLQAYAVDTSGNLSTTNTVHFEYIVRTPLTVAINGKGTLTPNYNGKLLALNLGYAMTATAAPGFRFTNWSGSLTTNTSTLRFLMASNLTFTANFVDVARPVVSITSPTNNLHVTNSAFTATGKAGDNVGVNSVYYSLDGSGWTLAATTNHWTKWTAGLALTPGTNTLQAYAVDTSGNLSTTNTVHFEYIVRTPLTVAINGKGTLTPNYNGKLLALNLGYAMTATAAPGFRFTNWSGSLTTNTSTLRFLMASNLTFTANFVDVARPVVSITSPTNNLHVTNSAFTATGKAGDNVGVNSVYYSLDGSGWTLAATTNHWTKWTAGLALTPGTNTLQAYAVDTSGNLSTTNTVHFEYIVRTPLTVASAISSAEPAPNFTPIVSPPAAEVVTPPAPASLTPGAFANGQYSLTVTGTENAQYVVQASTNLVDWIPVETNAAPFNYTDMDAAKFSQRYYRAVSVQTP